MGLIAIIACCFFDAAILSLLWGWLAVPVLGVRDITMAGAFALITLRSFLKPASKGDRTVADIVTSRIFSAIICVTIGAILHFFFLK